MKTEIDFTFELAFGALPPGLKMANGVDPFRTDRVRDFQHLSDRIAAPQDQRDPLCLESSAKRFEAVMQPPALRTADRPVPGPIIVKNIDGNDRAVVRRSHISGLIGQPQILPKPQKAGHWLLPSVMA
ncbi:hypothetical protein FHS96_001411 [Sphingomonas zeicaulis]